MTKLKRIAALFLGLSLMTGIMTGCGEKKGASEKGNLELSVHMHFYGYCVFDDEWPVFKKAAELTGVTLRGTAVETVSDSGQAFSTMLADKTLPDIIHYDGTSLKKIGIQGALIPLDDLIEKHAPNIKKYFEECPDARIAATASDGHIYYIPGTLADIDQKSLPSQGFFIRQDWLDKLGLSTPKTVDEYYNVLKAFKEKDPNGNGKNDEVPYFKRTGSIADLYQLFGAHEGYYINENGEYTDGKTEPELKTAVENLARWYKEGLIDKEFYTRGEQAREQLLSSDLGGSTHDWFSSTASYNSKYTGFGLNFVPMAPPADINGVVKEDFGRSILHGLGWGISKDNKHPEETIKYFDFWLSEEGTKLASVGVEGVHYNMKDGQIQFTDEVLNGDGGVPSYLRNQGALIEIGSIHTIDAELAGMNETARSGFNEYKDNGWVSPSVPPLSFTESEQEVIDANETNITTFYNEQIQKWILGAEDVNATWDSYLETLKSLGNDELTRVNKESYKRSISE
ncbi:MAG: extracellular solute-binding protein [Clostridia bacterium]|nr:extracellular solute-binding protein [Clostridia bacterium]